MVVNTTPKDILDKLGIGVEVVQDNPLLLQNIAYTGLFGATIKLLTTDASGDLQVDIKTIAPISGRSKVYSDTNFVVGDSPITLDVNTDLGRNAIDGFVINDGDGNFTVAISDDGITYGDALTMENGEIFSLTNLNIDSIKITWVANSAYRVFVV